MRIRSVCALLAVCILSACGGGSLFKTYEYEEDMYLSLDGTATLYVNSSVAALNALRGTTFDTALAKAPDREALRAYFSSPGARVDRVTLSRRSSRRYIHVRIQVDNVEALAQAAPFSWSTISFKRDGDLFYYRQSVGASGRTRRWRRRVAGKRAGRLPHAPAQQDRLSQRRVWQPAAGQHSRVGAIACRIGCTALR